VTPDVGARAALARWRDSVGPAIFVTRGAAVASIDLAARRRQLERARRRRRRGGAHESALDVLRQATTGRPFTDRSVSPASSTMSSRAASAP